MLHHLLNTPERERRGATASLAGSAAWGTVTWVDSGASMLRCSIETFDGGEVVDFGPVIYADLSGSGVARGDRVLLLAVADGDEPAAALKFPG